MYEIENWNFFSSNLARNIRSIRRKWFLSANTFPFILTSIATDTFGKGSLLNDVTIIFQKRCNVWPALITNVHELCLSQTKLKQFLPIFAIAVSFPTASIFLIVNYNLQIHWIRSFAVSQFSPTTGVRRSLSKQSGVNPTKLCFSSFSDFCG